ncbi:hypothetical protein BY996DRAFT_6408574 [Phakopsora pachyrhizi]|uniref:Expressed protein n=1 Tax=Phakopsora pachyrhizi TaxID=170000 RepID=A0AAV0BGU0_PHAPC|nr:hypothetical protein BY996DRAFT_6408574 [Phakopsora pachyrhizi]CAH7685703.1 expressed protein [Phakopsora pachyrhizi]
MSRQSKLATTKFLAALASVHEEEACVSDDDSISDIEIRRQHILESMAKLEGKPSSGEPSSEAEPNPGSKSNSKKPPGLAPSSFDYFHGVKPAASYQMGLSQEGSCYSNQEMMMQMMMMRMMMAFPGVAVMGAAPMTNYPYGGSSQHYTQSAALQPNHQMNHNLSSSAFQGPGLGQVPFSNQYTQPIMNRGSNQTPRKTFLMMASGSERDQLMRAAQVNWQYPSQIAPKSIHSVAPHHQTSGALKESHSFTPSTPLARLESNRQNYLDIHHQDEYNNSNGVMGNRADGRTNGSGGGRLSSAAKKFMETVPPLPPKNQLATMKNGYYAQLEINKRKKDDLSWLDY